MLHVYYSIEKYSILWLREFMKLRTSRNTIISLNSPEKLE